MILRKLTLLTSVVLLLGLSAGALAALGSKTETFDTAASAASHGWVDIGSRLNGWDFGFSNTSEAGGVAGEAGGKFTRNTSKVFYVDSNLGGNFTEIDMFSANGKVNFKTVASSSQASYIAFANTANTDSSNALGLLWSRNGNGTTFDIWVFFDYNGIHYEGGLNGQTGDATKAFIQALAPGKYLFEIEYNGESSVLTVNIRNTDGSLRGSGYLNLKAINPATTLNLNCFGMVGRNMSSTVTTRNSYVYMDDVTYGVPLPRIQFEVPSSMGIESLTPAIIKVKLFNAEAGQTYTVDYSVLGGTAQGNDVDYSLVPGTLTFNPGDTSKDISIDIVNDGILETDETIILSLSNVTGPNSVIGISQHTYTISDGPPSVFFASSASSGSEGLTPALIEVKLSHATDQVVTVDYAIAGGTATGSGVDYTLASGSLTFNPSEVSKNISIDIIDDSLHEKSETINLALSNPQNASLGSPSAHSYTITDNEQGVLWDGTVWYYSATNNNRLFVNSQNQLEWKPEKQQYVTRIPDKRLSVVGDVVEVIYWWMTDGAHSCPSCTACPGGCYDDDITCLAGTSDLRVGLFEADGQYVEADGLGVSNSIFKGYKGYQFRFGPNMRTSSPTRWVDCTGEAHKTGQIKRNDPGMSDILSGNDHPTLRDLPGFGLPPGDWTLFTMRLERTSSSSVKVSMTFNGKTYSVTDTSASLEPQKIDVLGIYMRNGRPFTRLVLDKVCEGVGDADFDNNDKVDGSDLVILGQDWLKNGTTELRGNEPNAANLILHYGFDGALNNDITSVVNLAGMGFNLTKFVDSNPAGSTGALKYGSANPMIATGTSADFQNSSGTVNDPGTALFASDTGVNTAIDLSTIGAFTLEAFIKPDSIRQSVIVRKYTFGSNNGMWYLDLRPTGEVGFTVNGDLNVITSGAGSVAAGTWYHVAGVFSEAFGMKLYLDGEEVKSSGYKTRPTDSVNALGVGAIVRDNVNPPAYCGQFYDGMIDEVKLYGYALSEDEVIYDAYNGTALIQMPPNSKANLYDDDIIDLKDFAEFALQWLDECE